MNAYAVRMMMRAARARDLATTVENDELSDMLTHLADLLGIFRLDVHVGGDMIAIDTPGVEGHGPKSWTIYSDSPDLGVGEWEHGPSGSSGTLAEMLSVIATTAYSPRYNPEAPS